MPNPDRANLSSKTKTLAPCPGSPTCVCSQSPDDEHYIPAIEYFTDVDEAHSRLAKMLDEDKKADWLIREDRYFHVRYRAFIFWDDLEFYFPEDQPIIHVRSASRVGYSDFGANRRRVEKLRKRFSSQS